MQEIFQASRPDIKSDGLDESQFLIIENYKLPFIAGFSAMVVLQLLVWFDADALLCAGLAILGGVIGIFYALDRDKLQSAPLSTLMVLGYTLYYFILPPFATLLEGKGLVNNLELPVFVFTHAFVFLLALIATHLIYLNTPFFQIIQRGISEKVYTPLGFFSAVSPLQLFAMGAIGVIANLFSASSGDLYTNEGVGIFGKLIQGFFPLMYVPYCIVLLPLLGETKKPSRQQWTALGVYSILLIIVSVARNSRGVLFSGIASMLIAYCYCLAIRLLPKPNISGARILLGAVLFVFLANPVSDLSTAMVVVRSQRVDIGPLDLVSATLDQYEDKIGLRRYRAESDFQIGDWDEKYVDNIFFSRLSNLKFTDQSLQLAEAMDDGTSRYLGTLEWQRVLGILPQPVLDFFRIDANKEFVNASSGGDLMLFAITGSKYVLGGFRTGSLLGSGYALFGWLYPIFVSFTIIFLFGFLEAQILKKEYFSENGRVEKFIMNPLCITSLFTWMFTLTSAANGIESVSGLFQYIFRGWLQVVIIYAIVFVASKFLVKPFKGLLD